MFDSVQFVREICAQRKVPISTLEKECGFANGYLNPKKLKKIPYDRAITIGKYLGIPAERILTGEETKKEAAVDNGSPDEVSMKIAEIILRLSPAQKAEALHYLQYLESKSEI